MGKTYTGFIGSYTKETSEGVYRFTLDTEAKKITNVEVAAKLNHPTYLAITRDNEYLYAISQEGDQGGIAAFAINNGELEKLNSQVTPGAAPCHVSVDSKNSLVVSANYHTTLVEAFLTNEDGSLQPPKSVAHEGDGPHERQEKPHVHYAGFTPDEKYVVVVDLGNDTVTTYEPHGAELKQVSQLKVKAGSGPRHIAFHPHAPYAYVMTELSNEVIVMKFDAEAGTFEEVEYVSTIPEDFTENNQGSAIHITSDGKFIYVGNRGHNSIGVFRILDDYHIELVDWTHTEGKWPRDFALDPSERFIVASNQHSGTLTLFERDQETGKLTLLQKDIEAPESLCVKFLHE